MVAPFAMWLEGLLVNRPQQRAQIAELHDDHNHSVMTLKIRVYEISSTYSKNHIEAL